MKYLYFLIYFIRSTLFWNSVAFTFDLPHFLLFLLTLGTFGVAILVLSVKSPTVYNWLHIFEQINYGLIQSNTLSHIWKKDIGLYLDTNNDTLH